MTAAFSYYVNAKSLRWALLAFICAMLIAAGFELSNRSELVLDAEQLVATYAGELTHELSAVAESDGYLLNLPWIVGAIGLTVGITGLVLRQSQKAVAAPFSLPGVETRRIMSTKLEADTGGRISAAMAELLPLLPVAEGRRITEREFAAMLTWRATHRKMLAHPVLKGFVTWFDGFVSDGICDAAEREDLLAFCSRFAANEVVAVPPGRDSGMWRSLPAGEHQLTYLRMLAVAEAQCDGLTRGEACDLIDSQDEDRSSALRQALQAVG